MHPARILPLIVLLGLLAGGCQKTPVNMFQGSNASDALAEINKKIGHPAKVLKVEMTPLSLSLQVQDPSQPSHVDEYRLEHSYALDNRFHHVSLSGPNPVQLDLINPNLEENLFDLNEVNIAGTANIAQDAVRAAALEEGGAVTEITISRQLFLLPAAHNGDVQWDISVKTDREYATAYANAKGALTHLNLDGTNRAKNLDLYSDQKALQEIAESMRRVLGAAPMITHLHFEKSYLWFDARNPDNPKKLMSFTANLNGVLMKDASMGPILSKPLPDDAFFAVNDVDWAALPGLLKKSLDKLGIPGGRIYKVTLDKATITGEAQPLTWDISVRDSGGDAEEGGEMFFTSKGDFVRRVLPKSRRPEVNLFDPDSAKAAIEGIRAKFGAHAMLMELMLEEKRAILIARNPADKAKLRDFIYDEDHFSDFPGSDRTPFYRDFQDDWLFDIYEVDANLLPKLSDLEKQTLGRLKIPNAKIESVTVSRQKNLNPDNQKVLIEIRASGDGDKSGWVNYDLQGNFVSIMTP